MSWIPQLKVTGGLIGGSTIPDGYLDDCLNNFILDTPGHGLTTSGSMLRGMIQDEETARWKGAFGRNILSQIYGYAETHVGEQTNDITLAEMVCALPQGAQYWKQTIALVINVGEPTIDETQDYKTLHFVPYFMKIERREYATPYADAYTSTPLNDLYGNLTRQVFLLAGDEEDARGFFADSMIIGAGSFSYDHNDYYGFAIYGRKHRWDGEANRSSICLLGVTKTTLDTAYGGSFDPEEQTDPNEEDPPEDGPGKGGGGGGEGDHILPDEPIPIPPVPTFGSSSVSWLTTYMMSLSDINDFGNELVDPDPMQMLKQYFVDPLDAVVNITMCPVIPNGPRYQKTPIIHASPTDYEWSRSFTAISGQYGVVDCGFIDIAPYWDSAFDFDPFTQFHIFLPFIGYRQLNADEIMGAKIGVKYHVDVVNGDCVAFVTKSAPSESIYGPMPEQVIGQYNGNCGIAVPIGRISHDAFVGSMLNLMTVGASIAVGGVVGGEMAAGNVSEAQLASQLTSSGMNACTGSKSKIERSGALGSNCGYMGVRKPYIIRSIARQSLPDNYKELNGYPCNKGGTLGEYSGTGLAVVESIQLNNIPAMEEERKEILEWLKGGVLI